MLARIKARYDYVVENNEGVIVGSGVETTANEVHAVDAVYRCTEDVRPEAILIEAHEGTIEVTVLVGEKVYNVLFTPR